MTHRLFCTIAEDPAEYRQDFFPDDELISLLKATDIDILAFRERSWCSKWSDLPFGGAKICKDNVAIANFDDYEDWLTQLPNRTKARLRMAREQHLEVRVVDPWEKIPFNNETEGIKLAKGIWEIYNETPVRQFRPFNHYGVSLVNVQEHVFHSDNIFIGAYVWTEEENKYGLWLRHKLVGFVELDCSGDTGVFSQILSRVSFSKFMPNNALIAKAVEICSAKGLKWLIYARMGNHPSLDRFKQNNGFRKCEITRAFVPLSSKGRIGMLLGLDRGLKDRIPNFIKPIAIPVFNWGVRAIGYFRMNTYPTRTSS